MASYRLSHTLTVLFTIVILQLISPPSVLADIPRLISYQGKVKGCGYLDVEAGDIRKESFSEVWVNSPLFSQLRDLSNLKGKCGACEYKGICGGCRARAYEATGDYLEVEPYCIYQP